MELIRLEPEYHAVEFNRQRYGLDNDAQPLNLTWSRFAVSTLEVDLDTREGGWDYVDPVLAAFARKKTDVTATICVREQESSNRNYRHWAGFFGVHGQKKKKVLDCLQRALRSVGDPPKVWMSDSMRFDADDQVRHIEDGRLWLPHEPGAWISLCISD